MRCGVMNIVTFFLLFVIDKKSVRVPCSAVVPCYMLILPAGRGARVSFSTHTHTRIRIAHLASRTS